MALHLTSLLVHWAILPKPPSITPNIAVPTANRRMSGLCSLVSLPFLVEQLLDLGSQRSGNIICGITPHSSQWSKLNCHFIAWCLWIAVASCLPVVERKRGHQLCSFQWFDESHLNQNFFTSLHKYVLACQHFQMPPSCWCIQSTLIKKNLFCHLQSCQFT